MSPPDDHDDDDVEVNNNNIKPKEKGIIRNFVDLEMRLKFFLKIVFRAANTTDRPIQSASLVLYVCVIFAHDKFVICKVQIFI